MVCSAASGQSSLLPRIMRANIFSKIWLFLTKNCANGESAHHETPREKNKKDWYEVLFGVQCNRFLAKHWKTNVDNWIYKSYCWKWKIGPANLIDTYHPLSRKKIAHYYIIIIFITRFIFFIFHKKRNKALISKKIVCEQSKRRITLHNSIAGNVKNDTHTDKTVGYIQKNK